MLPWEYKDRPCLQRSIASNIPICSLFLYAHLGTENYVYGRHFLRFPVGLFVWSSQGLYRNIWAVGRQEDHTKARIQNVGEATQGMCGVEVWAWLSQVHKLQSSVLLTGKKRKEKFNQITELLLSNFLIFFLSCGCKGHLPLPGFIPPNLVDKMISLQRVCFEEDSVAVSLELSELFTMPSLEEKARESKHLLQFLPFQ